MPVTLDQAELLSLSHLRDGVIQTLQTVSPVLNYIPWEFITGNAYAYNLQLTEGNVNFYNPNEAWKESVPTWEERTVAIKIMGDDADVDKFLAATRSNITDLKAAVIEMKVKALANKFEEVFVYGRTCTDSNEKQPKGLLRHLAECEGAAVTDLDGIDNPAVVPGSATSATITLDILDGFMDTPVFGKFDCLMTSAKMRAKITSSARAAGYTLMMDKTQWGMPIESWAGTPLMVNRAIPNNFPDAAASVTAITTYNRTTARADTVDNTPIFGIQWGEEALFGIQASDGIVAEDLGTLESYDATRVRFKWYWALVLAHTKRCAVLTGCKYD